MELNTTIKAEEVKKILLKETISNFQNTIEEEFKKLSHNDDFNVQNTVAAMVEKLRSDNSSAFVADPEELKHIMALTGYKEADAVRTLIINEELIKLKNDGLDMLEAVEELILRAKLFLQYGRLNDEEPNYSPQSPVYAPIENYHSNEEAEKEESNEENDEIELPTDKDILHILGTGSDYEKQDPLEEKYDDLHNIDSEISNEEDEIDDAEDEEHEDIPQSKRRKKKDHEHEHDNEDSKIPSSIPPSINQPPLSFSTQTNNPTLSVDTSNSNIGTTPTTTTTTTTTNVKRRILHGGEHRDSPKKKLKSRAGVAL